MHAWEVYFTWTANDSQLLVPSPAPPCTGGPATTVSWRRDGTMLSDDSTYSITSQVIDTETATYIHTLTVTGRLVGEYQCSVSNIRTPSESTRSLTVLGSECGVA